MDNIAALRTRTMIRYGLEKLSSMRLSSQIALIVGIALLVSAALSAIPWPQCTADTPSWSIGGIFIGGC